MPNVSCSVIVAGFKLLTHMGLLERRERTIFF